MRIMTKALVATVAFLLLLLGNPNVSWGQSVPSISVGVDPATARQLGGGIVNIKSSPSQLDISIRDVAGRETRFIKFETRDNNRGVIYKSSTGTGEMVKTPGREATGSLLTNRQLKAEAMGVFNALGSACLKPSVAGDPSQKFSVPPEEALRDLKCGNGDDGKCWCRCSSGGTLWGVGVCTLFKAAAVWDGEDCTTGWQCTQPGVSCKIPN